MATTQQDETLPAYNFGQLVSNARLAQIIALFLQLLLIWAEADRLGWFYSLFAMLPIAGNAVHTAMRFAKQLDGRWDLHQLLSVRDHQLRLRHAYAVLTPFLLGVLAMLILGELPSTLSSFLYKTAQLVQLVAAGGVTCLEAIETYKNRA